MRHALRPAQRRRVGAGIAHLGGEFFGDLLDPRGLAHLPRPGEPARASRGGGGGKWSAHDTGCFYSVI